MVLFVYAASDSNAVEMISYTSEYSLIWIVIGMIIATGLTLNRKYTSFPTWYFVTWLSYTRMLGLVNSNLDSSAIFFFARVSKGLNGIQIITHYEAKSSNNRFAELDYESYHFLNNTEKFLVVFFGCVGIYIALIVLSFCYGNVKKFKEEVCINMMVRAVIVCSFDFFLFGFLQIYNINLDSGYESVCSVFAVLLVGVCMICTVYFPIYISGQQEGCKSAVHDSTLLFEFKYQEGLKAYYYCFFLGSRLISALLLVFLQDYPSAQVSIIGSCILLLGIYVLKYRPYRNTLTNYWVIACESTQLLILICLACYIPDIPEIIQGLLRWLIIFSFWVGVILCSLRFLIDMLKKNPSRKIDLAEGSSAIDLRQKRGSEIDLANENPGKGRKRMSIFGDLGKQQDNVENFTPSGGEFGKRIEQDSSNSNRNKLNSGGAYDGFRDGRNSAGSKDSGVQGNQLKSRTEKIGMPAIEDMDESQGKGNDRRYGRVDRLDDSSGQLVESNDPINDSGISYYSKLARKYTSRTNK